MDEEREMSRKEEETYDVVIVGAGPAGLKCAEILGGEGLSVIVLEKKNVVGPKVCAGGLTLLTNNFELPVKNTLTFEKQHIILNGKEHVVPLENPLHIIERSELGQYQLELIRKYGNVEVRTGTAVGGVFGDHVLSDDGRKLHFRYLVGADGSMSVVRRHLGLRNGLYMGIQYNIPVIHDRLVWFLNPSLLMSGYGWIFPHRGYTSAGVFFNPGRVPAPVARRALNEFLDDYGMDYRGVRLEGAPVNCLCEGLKFDNIFLAGDAAGLVSAGTGEGIAYALASGEDVARNILDGNYNFDGVKRMLRFKKRQEHILRIFDAAPFLQSFLFRVLISLMGRPGFQRYFGN